MTPCVVGFVTCPSPAEARKLARVVLSKKLAACVNIFAGVESHYWWRGRRERAKECLLLIKTTQNKANAVTQTIKANHSYQLPEIIFVPIQCGERNYLKWIRASVVALALALCGVAPARANRVDDLIEQLGSTNEIERAEAAERLAEIGGSRAEGQFRAMLGSKNPEQRQMAVVGLLQVSDVDEDVERVRARLKDENSTVRWSAVVALQQRGRVGAVPWLQDVAANDSSESVKEAATEAVAKLSSSIRWARTLADALKQARVLRKPVLAYFFVRGSEFCQQFEEGVLADKDVVDAAQEFVCVRVDATNRADDARKFDVRGAPTVLILDSSGNEMSRVAGLVEKAKFLARLAETRRGRLTFREARRLALKNPGDVQANWKVAETHLEEGREDLAEPFLRNVIEHDEPNQYGYTDNAMFALGFALGKRGQHAQAVYCFERLRERWPDFKDQDKALYCLGLSQLALGYRDEGESTLRMLVQDFPDSKAVPAARQTLEKLEKK